MPRLPKILADIGEKRLGIPCTVTDTVYLHATLKRVRFQGDLTRKSFVPGQVTEFRVSPNDFRHYTPTLYDPEKGICDILFYLHDKGPGSRWASALEVGHRVNMLRPGGRMQLAADNRYHFFFGDETALGLFRYLKEAVHGNGQEYLGILELNEEATCWPDKLDLSVDIVPKSIHEQPASEAVAYLNGLHGLLWKTWMHAAFYLAGRAASIQVFRKALLARGVSSKRISTYAYWSDGKRGL
jgi:NADPH-dependent ferric siderophore reductase